MHQVLRLWTRPEEVVAMSEQESLTLVAGRGVEGDHTFGRMRHVTLIFEDDWKEACEELGVDVDPAGRRANVLLSGGNGGRLIGQRITLGDALVHVRAETRPCPVMEKGAVGLKEALRPNTRAGVWGRVETSGSVRVGDAMVVHGEPTSDVAS